MPSNVYKDDTVCFLDQGSRCAYVGTVLRSDKICPGSLSLDESDADDKGLEGIEVEDADTKTVSASSEGGNKKTADESNADKKPIKVTWTSLTTGDDITPSECPIPTSYSPEQLTLLERDHMLADTVRHAKRDAVGTVVNVHIRACAELLSYGRVIFDLDCSRLRSVYPWTSHTSENLVIWNGWLGRVVACHMLAVLRFTDGARLLVKEECLRDFEPVQPTSNAFPDTLFEGAWITGDAYDFKLNPEVMNFQLFDALTVGSNVRIWSSSPDRRSKRARGSSVSASTENLEDKADIENKNAEYLNQCPSKPFPPGHPFNLFRALSRSSATKPLIEAHGLSARIMERTPLFLTETRKHNSRWLAHLRSSATVSVYVEHLAPAEATVHWFANRNPASGRSPPSVIRGEDLSKLQTVVPYAFQNCTGRDVWYYELQSTDEFYNVQAYDTPEQLLYDWFTHNETHLNSIKSSPTPEEKTEHLPDKSEVFQQSTASTAPQNAAKFLHIPSDQSVQQASSEIPAAPVPASSGDRDGASKQSVLEKTTPFWAQQTLFHSSRRRNRVVVDRKHKMTYSRLADWKSSHADYSSDEDSGDDQESVVILHAGKKMPTIRISHTQTSSKKSAGSAPKAAGAGAQDEKKSSVRKTKQSDTSNVSSAVRSSPAKNASVDGIRKSNKEGVCRNCEKLDSSGGEAPPVNTAADKNKNEVSEDEETVKVDEEEVEEDKEVGLRASQLPDLHPGSWVAVGLYYTRTEYDVRWQDGSFEKNIPYSDLLPVYFNIDEHDFFPGYVVSLKSAKDNPISASMVASKTQLDEETSNQLNTSEGTIAPTEPRDFGVVLSANPKDRTCLVQWFRSDNETPNGGQMIPSGKPEEAGVYELAGTLDRQLCYGDILLLNTVDDPAHAEIPAGYIEDLVPETGKLVIRWMDRSKSEITRSECLFPLDALDDDDDWTDDDSDEEEPSELTSDADSEWETDSYEWSDQDEAKDHGTQNKDEEQEADSYEESVRKAAEKVVLSYQHTEAARRLFSDRRAFVFWILRRFVVVPGESETVVDQFGTLLAAAAVSPSSKGDKSAAGTDASETKSSVLDAEVMPDSESQNSKTPIMGKLLSPARAWDYSEENEAITVADNLHSVRVLMQEAYQLAHDFRLKKLYCRCDHRELFSEKHVEGILKSIEIDGGISVSPSEESEQSKRKTAASEAVGAKKDSHAPAEASPSSPCEVAATGANSAEEADDTQTAINAKISNENVLQADILMALRLSQMKVLILPDSAQPFVSSSSNWRNRVHYSLVKSEPEKEGSGGVYMIVSSTLFHQLTNYLTGAQKRLLEQLTDFGVYALAWLGEVAPDLLPKATVVSGEEDQNAAADAQGHKGSILTGQKESESKKDVSKASNGCPDLELLSSAAENVAEPSQNAPLNGPNKRDSPADVVLERKDSVSTPAVDAIPLEYRGQFILEDTAPTSHHFYRSAPDSLPRSFHKAWRRDTTLLSTSIPKGIIVKGFSDRIDLYSLLIVGPAGTPYEHGLFIFDIQLPSRYPSVPPHVHFYSFASERINPNLYVEGHVCLSLLGTWTGKDSENWDERNSNLLQLVVSLQGLILNSEPYFNEAGFDACRGTEDAREKSRTYNESVVATLIQSMVSLLKNPVSIFKQEIIQHCVTKADAYASLLEFWASLDEAGFKNLNRDTPSSSSTKHQLPEFPLAPVSKGFQISVRRHRLAFLHLVASTKQAASGQ